MHIKSNNYQVSRVYLQDEVGEYREVYSLHPANQSALGHSQLAQLEINKNRITDMSIEKLIDFLQELKSTS